MTLGTKIDELYALRATRLGVEKEVAELKSKETELKDEIIHILGDTGLGAARGHVATASLKAATKPIITNWREVYDYIKVNDRFDLLHQRISSLAWAELEKDGILVPGTEAFTEVTLSLTKAAK